jgi:hypothetical protein
MRPRHPQANRKSKKVLGLPQYLLWILLAVAVLALVIPLAVMFGRKKARTPDSSILVPLYIYPSPGAWDPLYTAIKAYPSLNFTLVINPASGPGEGNGPDANYTKEIPVLNSYPNVRLVGYVSTNYTNRNLTLALDDIATYASWAENATYRGLDMQGIFLDETPTQYTDASAHFLEACALAVRSNSTGFGVDPLIIQNPGTIPDARFMDSCNTTVAFEGTYSTYQIYGLQKNISSFQKEHQVKRDRVAVILHDVPDLSEGDQGKLVKSLRNLGGSIFITGLQSDYYSNWWSGWSAWVADMKG